MAPTMPHICFLLAAAASPSGLFLLRPLPVFQCDLLVPGQGQLVRRCRLADGGARADGSARAHFHRRDEIHSRTDERAVADDGAVLVGAVVVAGDGARAHVDLAADGGVAYVGEVVHLAALADQALLHLDEIAGLGAVSEFRAGTEPRERADLAAVVD